VHEASLELNTQPDRPQILKSQHPAEIVMSPSNSTHLTERMFGYRFECGDVGVSLI